MFFQDLAKIPEIASKTSCVILQIPLKTKLKLKNVYYLTPDSSKKTPIIGVEELRDFISICNIQQLDDVFLTISPAEAMNEPAMNALLKTLEEPPKHCHFILLTNQPGKLLPTIRSRAQTFIFQETDKLAAAPQGSKAALEYAKRLIAATPRDLIKIAEEISAKKTRSREIAIESAALAVELLEKSYFKTQNPKFLQKIPAFINLYQALSENGHVKLHLVADLL